MPPPLAGGELLMRGTTFCMGMFFALRDTLNWRKTRDGLLVYDLKIENGTGCLYGCGSSGKLYFLEDLEITDQPR